jgi:hypothetical protein
MRAFMRPAIYKWAYNHITAIGHDGEEKGGGVRLVDVVKIGRRLAPHIADKHEFFA